MSNPNLEIMYTASQIQERVNSLGKELAKDYSQKTPLLVGVLKGSFIFMADLVRAIDIPLHVDFLAVSSYQGTESTGDVKILKDLSQSIRDRDVLLVEDIVDTGLTLFRLKELLGSRGARSVKIVTLLDKTARRECKDLVVDYTGFQIPNRFVVGYGLDYAELYRNLPFIGVVLDPNAL